MNNTKNIFLILVTLCISACSFGSTSEPARFYTLTTPHIDQVRGPTKSINVGIENVSVPQSVDRPQIIVKAKGTNTVTVSEFDRWIEGLNSALPVTISENMNMYAKNINARPIRNSSDASNSKYLVSIDFVKFETETDGKTTISAWWTVSDNHGDILVQKKTTQSADTPETKSGTPDYDATAALFSKLIANISYKIADVISEMK